MDNFLLIFITFTAGYLLKNIFAHNTSLILNQFILYISLPAMMLLQIPRLSFSFDVFIPIIIAWLVMAISAIIIFYLSKFFSFSREVTGALLLVGVLGNTSFIGIPITQAYYGDSSLAYVLMYDQLGSFIALSTYGTFISVYYSNGEDVNIKAIAKKILTFPTFIALIISVAFIGTTFNPIVTSVLESLAMTIVPLALVSVGLQLNFKLPKEELKPMLSALGVKIILAPLIAIGIVYIFSWEGFIANIAIMEASMGPMITAGAVASMAGLAPRLSSAIVGYGTIIAFLTTWIVYKILAM
ncbi:MAG: AEC family transporter [Campylobacterales bacterium]|nr:AEC family transporter [Campylobacterales bacterium]